jgi:hypothetical protein
MRSEEDALEKAASERRGKGGGAAHRPEEKRTNVRAFL